MGDKAVLAYSGGLDTSVTIRWLAERGYEVHAVAVDVGQQEDFEGVDRAGPPSGRGERAGDRRGRTLRRRVPDAARSRPTRCTRASTRWSRVSPGPCIAEEVIARRPARSGADVVAHGCTGKGNDQVRFEVSFARARARPRGAGADPRRHDPAREGDRAGRGVGHPRRRPSRATYSIDENLWGRTAECGPLEDPWAAPPEDAFARTAAPADRPGRARGGRRRRSSAACRSRWTASRCRCPS